MFVVPVSVLHRHAWPASASPSSLRAGNRVIYLLFVLGLTLPFEGVITPLYYEVRALGLLNTKFAIILPLIGLFMPFSVYWMRAHFVNVPAEMSEAAQIDGASAWQQFWLVQVPMAGRRSLSLAILQFLWTWNSFLLPVVLVENPLERTMAGALGAFQGQWGTNIPLLCAGSLIILAPTVMLFLSSRSSSSRPCCRARSRASTPCPVDVRWRADVGT